MPLTPICEVRINAGPWVVTTDGVDAVAGDTISIRLSDASAVTAWYLQPIGTDETSATPVLTGVNPVTFLVATPTTIPTYVIPAGTGRAYIFQSTVQGAGGPLVTTFAIYVLTAAGDRVGAVGESREGDQNFGWITKVNPLIRNPGAGGFTAGGDLSGTSVDQTVEAIQGVVISGAAAAGKVLTAQSDAAASWQDPGTGFTAGGDLSGTPTNQTVEAIQGVVITGAAAAGKVLTAQSDVAGSWQDPAPGFTAGGDLTGTPTNQTVAKINNATAPATPVLGDVGKVIGVTGAGVYGLVAQGGGGFVAGGDLTGSAVDQTVSKVRGIPSPDPALKTDGALVEVFNTPDPIVLDSARAMVSDATHIYVGQFSQWESGLAISPVVWRFEIAGVTASNATSLDLSATLGTVKHVRDLAQDNTYLYAALHEAKHIAIIDKATMTVAGWAYTDIPGKLQQNTVSVCVDDSGNFYAHVAPQGNFSYIQKFTTAACLGQPPNTVGPVSTLEVARGRWLRFGAVPDGGGGGPDIPYLWFTNGVNGPGFGGAPPLTRIDPVTMTVSASVPAIGGQDQMMMAIMAYGSVWVASYDAPITVYRIDPDTLGTIATIAPAGFTDFIQGMTAGSDSGGSSWVYLSCIDGRVGIINPLLNTWVASVVPNALGYFYEGIANIPNGATFIAAYVGWNAPPGSLTTIDYWDPAAGATGTLALPGNDNWALKYTALGGDVTGPPDATVVGKINGATAPATPVLGDVGKVIGVTGAGVYGLLTIGGDPLPTLTTDAVPTLAVRVPVAIGDVRSLRFIVKVRSTDGSGAVQGEWEVKAGYKRSGLGVLSQSYAPTITNLFVVGAPVGPTLSLNGDTDVDLLVTGIALTNLTWSVSETIL